MITGTLRPVTESFGAASLALAAALALAGCAKEPPFPPEEMAYRAASRLVPVKTLYSKDCRIYYSGPVPGRRISVRNRGVDSKLFLADSDKMRLRFYRPPLTRPVLDLIVSEGSFLLHAVGEKKAYVGEVAALFSQGAEGIELDPEGLLPRRLFLPDLSVRAEETVTAVPARGGWLLEFWRRDFGGRTRSALLREEDLLPLRVSYFIGGRILAAVMLYADYFRDEDSGGGYVPRVVDVRLPRSRRRVRFVMKEARPGAAIPAATFRRKPPRGAEVIELPLGETGGAGVSEPNDEGKGTEPAPCPREAGTRPVGSTDK